MQIPLDISHGREDFVVPYPLADNLAKWSASSSTRVFITGLYHHTGSGVVIEIISTFGWFAEGNLDFHSDGQGIGRFG